MYTEMIVMDEYTAALLKARFKERCFTYPDLFQSGYNMDCLN